jgi:hypothetical protein
VECSTLLDALGLGRSMARNLAIEDEQFIGGAVLVRNALGQQVDRLAIRQRDATKIKMVRLGNASAAWRAA